MPTEREALRALLSLVRREAPHLSGKVVGDAEAALASAPASEPVLEWCVHCGEGTTGFCRSKCENRSCPKGLPRPGQDSHPQAQVVGSKVYLVATGETHNGQETYTRHDAPVPLADQEVLCTVGQVAATPQCTCHPDDSPPAPCARKFALSECRAATSGGSHG